jgi:hypothetical protein
VLIAGRQMRRRRWRKRALDGHVMSEQGAFRVLVLLLDTLISRLFLQQCKGARRVQVLWTSNQNNSANIVAETIDESMSIRLGIMMGLIG